MFAVRSIRAPLARVTLRAAPVARFSALSVRFGEYSNSHPSHPFGSFLPIKNFHIQTRQEALFFTPVSHRQH